MIEEADPRRELLSQIITDRVAAHRLLFKRRHSLKTAPAHEEVIRDMHGPHPRIVFKAFRGFAKSTLAEETALIKAGLREFQYCVILGNTYTRAAQRLGSIKQEIDQNPYLNGAFGDLRGTVWNEGKIQLSNNVIFEVFGARQSMRGAKETIRPDFVLIDDLEDDEWVKSPDAVQENMRWFMSEFLPALAHPLRTPIRMLGTPLAERCLLNQLAAAEGWVERCYPVKYIDDEGKWETAWPDKYTLEDIDRIEAASAAMGEHRSFMQEYMCESEADSDRMFKPGMFIYEEMRVRTWQAVYVMVDPARTTNKGSATTGWAVWSWAPGGKLVVWECDGAFLQPSEVIDLMFRLNDEYRPVLVGVEEDGLNEWILQPIREAQVRRGVIPLRPMRAPRGKIDFIRGLQSYFAARTVEFAGTAARFSNAVGQFLSFPRGRIDAPNALAFASLLRPGEPVWPDFSPECVADDVHRLPHRPVWLALNADGAWVTGLLIQEDRGITYVLGDAVAEGSAGDAVEDMVREFARGARDLRIVVPRLHFDKWRNVGLAQALFALGKTPQAGAPPELGRAEIREALRRRVRGEPGLIVWGGARWALNGLSSGYAYPVLPGNVVATEPSRGVYRCLCEGLEAFAGQVQEENDDEGARYAYSRDGRRYRSALR